MDRPDVSRGAYMKDMDRPDVSREAYMNTCDHAYIVDLNDLPGVEEKVKKELADQKECIDEKTTMVSSYIRILYKHVNNALPLKVPDVEYKRKITYLYKDTKIFDERRAYEDHDFVFQIFWHHKHAVEYTTENNLSKKRIYWCIPSESCGGNDYIW